MLDLTLPIMKQQQRHDAGEFAVCSANGASSGEVFQNHK